MVAAARLAREASVIVALEPLEAPFAATRIAKESVLVAAGIANKTTVVANEAAVAPARLANDPPFLLDGALDAPFLPIHPMPDMIGAAPADRPLLVSAARLAAAAATSAAFAAAMALGVGRSAMTLAAAAAASARVGE